MPPAEKLAGLVAVALFFAAGWGWSEILPAIRRLPGGARWACSYLLGLGWVAGALYLLSHLFAVPLRRPAVLVVAALPAVAGLVLGGLRWKRAGASQEQPAKAEEPGRGRSVGSRLLHAFVLLVAGAITLAVLGEVLSHPPRDWDGRMTWSTQAKYVRAAATVDAPALRDPASFVTLPHYPLLLPVAQVAALELAGAGEDDPAHRPLYVVFLPVFLALIAWGVRARSGALAADLTVLLVALLPLLAFFTGGGASSSYSDLPLACFYGAGLWLLLQRRLDLSAGIAGGLLLAYGTLCKDEGGPLALAALLLAAAMWGWRRRSAKEGSGEGKAGERSVWREGAPLLAAGVLVGLALVFLAHWRAGIPLRYTPDYRGFLAERGFFAPLWERAPFLLERVRREMAKRELWGFLWWIAPVVLLAGRRGLRQIEAPALALAILAPLSLVTFVYAITDIPAALPAMTWNRFLLQGGVPFFTLFGWALGDLLRSRRE